MGWTQYQQNGKVMKSLNYLPPLISFFSILLMEQTNIISKVFHTYYFNCLATLQDIENRHEISPCATRRLAAYTEDNLKLHLRFSNKTANTIKF